METLCSAWPGCFKVDLHTQTCHELQENNIWNISGVISDVYHVTAFIKWSFSVTLFMHSSLKKNEALNTFLSTSFTFFLVQIIHLHKIFISPISSICFFIFIFLKPWINPLSANPEKMVKHTQTNRRQFADDLFECVWPFYEFGA